MNTSTFSRALRPIIILLVIAAVVVAGYWWFVLRPAATSGDLTASGTIEAQIVRLAPEMGGRVTEITVDEGQAVTAGQVLIKLDDTTLQAQAAQVQAALEAAQANLALLQAGPTPEQVQMAEAQLAQAEANLKIVQANLTNLAGSSRPEEVNASWIAFRMARTRYAAITGSLTSDQLEKVRQAKIFADTNLAEAQARHDTLAADNRNPDFAVAASAAAITDAQAMADIAKQTYELAQNESTLDTKLFEQMSVALETAKSNHSAAQARLDWLTANSDTSANALEAAQTFLTDTQTQLDDSQAAYDVVVSGSGGKKLTAAWDEVLRTQEQLAALLTGLATTPQTAPAARVSLTTFEATLGQVDVATAARDLTAANLAALKSGARTEQIQAAQAQVQAVQVQLKKAVLIAPVDGIVLSRAIEPGELAAPGATVLEIGKLNQLEVTIYLPENKFALVTPGETATLQVDAYPNRTFTATVLKIADQAQFTPRNVQTVEGRKDTVFAVRLSIANPDLALKPGMPADVNFGQK